MESRGRSTIGSIGRRSAVHPLVGLRDGRRRAAGLLAIARIVGGDDLLDQVVAHHITYDGHPDAYPLHVLAKILSDGDSSRIYRSLVYEKQIALAAFGEAKLIEHPNLFYAVAIVQPGNKPEVVLRELQGQLDRVKTEGVTPAELNRAKRQFARDYILGRDTAQQKALHLAHAVVIHNDIKTADSEFDLFQAVTVADVQRVARTYFTPESRMLLTILPRGGAPGGGLPPGFEIPREGAGR